MNLLGALSAGAVEASFAPYGAVSVTTTAMHTPARPPRPKETVLFLSLILEGW
jgi:hypothetical protein